MEYKELITVLSTDKRLHSKHICLFVALLYYWAESQCQSTFRVTRENLMKLSKIGSKATYHKCIAELTEYGYIKYMPTYNSYVGTRVYLRLNFFNKRFEQ